MGKVNGLQEKRNSLKVGFGNTQIEIRDGDQRVRIGRKTVLVSAPVHVSDGKWMVPSDFLTSVLPSLTGQPVEFQSGTNRVFLGAVKPSSFTVRMDPVNNGARLTFKFTDKISVHTASVNGKWVMFLGDHAIEPLEPSFQFHNPYVADVHFDDQDGQAKLVITPSAGGLNFYPLLAEGGKVLIADILKPPQSVAQAPPTATKPPTAANAPPATAVPLPGVTPGEQAPAPASPLPVVVLDAGHGGDDAGARSHDGVTEKDLVSQLVARVRQAVLATQKYRVVLTRTGDANVTFEQRALTANEATAVYFLTFHAGDLGGPSPRIAVYTYQSPGLAPSEEARPIFVPWNQVQDAYLDESRKLAQTLQQQFAVIAGVTADAPTAAPVRALRSVNCPAVAIEIGSLSPASDACPLADSTFQQQLSSVVAEVLAALRAGGA